jgi:hypothetical protein
LKKIVKKIKSIKKMGKFAPSKAKEHFHLNNGSFLSKNGECLNIGLITYTIFKLYGFFKYGF